MGWPMVPSADLYAGGPAYPLSSLGVRLRVRPSENLTLLGGVFQDSRRAVRSMPMASCLARRGGAATSTCAPAR